MDCGTMTLSPGPEDCDNCRCSTYSGFKKLFQTKQGVVVYQRAYGVSDESKLDISDLPKFSEAVPAAATPHGSPDDAKKMPADDNTVIVIHNTNENDIQSADLLPEFDIDTVSCPRCRYKMALAKKLLANVPVVEKKNIRGVCDLCALKQLSRFPCHVCQSVIKQFVTTGIKDERLDDYTKKRIMSYITNVKRVLQSDMTVEQKRMVRSFSECNITKIIERKHKRDQHLKRPKSGPEIDFAVQHLSDEFEEVLDMSEKKKVIILEELISVVPKADISTEKMYLKKNLDELVSLKPALKTVVASPAPQKEVQRSDHVDFKIKPYRSGDVVKATKSDTVLGIGTTGLMRRAYSDDSLITSFTGITEEILKKNFKYFFPRIIKKDENLLKTSPELIHDAKTGKTEEVLRKNFKYFFPRIIKKDENILKTSAELIHDAKTGITEEILRKNFKYFFPRINKKDENILKTSAELIHDAKTGITEEILRKDFKYFFPRIIKKDENILKTSAELIHDAKTRLQSNFQDEMENKDAIKMKKEQIKTKKEQEKEMVNEELRRKIELAKRQRIIPSDDNISYEIDKKTGYLVEKKEGKSPKKEGIEIIKKTITGNQKKELDRTMQKITEKGKHGFGFKVITGKQKLMKKEKRASDGKATAPLKRKLLNKEPEEKERKQKLKTKEKHELDVKVITGKRKFMKKDKRYSDGKATAPPKRKFIKNEPEEKERKQKIKTKEKHELDVKVITGKQKLMKKEKRETDEKATAPLKTKLIKKEPKEKEPEEKERKQKIKTKEKHELDVRVITGKQKLMKTENRESDEKATAPLKTKLIKKEPEERERKQKIKTKEKHELDVKVITGKQKLMKKEKRESDEKATAPLKTKLIKKEPEEKERKQKIKTEEKHELDVKVITGKQKLMKKEKRESDEKATAPLKTKLITKELEEKERKQKIKTKEKQETDDILLTSSPKLTKKEKETPIKRKHLSTETLWAQSIPKGLTNTLELVPKAKKQTTTEAGKKETATRVKITVETVDEKVGSDVISDIPDGTEIPTKDGLSGDDGRQTEKIKNLKGGNKKKTIFNDGRQTEKTKNLKGGNKKKTIFPHKNVFQEEHKVKKKSQLSKEHVKVLNKVLTKQDRLAVKVAKLKSEQKSNNTKVKQRADKAIQPLEDDSYEEIVYVKMKKEENVKRRKYSKEENIQSEKETNDGTKLKVEMDKIKIIPSGDNLLAKLVKMKQSADSKQAKNIKPIAGLPIPIRRRVMHTQTSETESEDQSEAATDETIKGSIVGELVLGNKIIDVENVPPEPEPKSQPVLFQSVFDERGWPKGGVTIIETPSVTAPLGTGGVFKYALSDRRYIDNGWTLLPEEKIFRKMNIYRMRPTQPEFDWFERNKDKRLLYDSGERLAETDHSGRGRWYYKNGRIALDYYDTAETNAQQRFVLYSSGEVDDRGRSLPVTILGMFDYIGNGIVFDHYGKIRLKYNQSEGVVLDRGIGPVSHWKWHSLNDPPELQQVMIDTQMNFKDPDILALSDPHQDLPRQDDEEMLAIEFENFIKAKNVKPNQKFVPNQIRLKALKINDQFSLRVLDQKTIYLLFRDGSTKLKLNLGMELDHNEIVDTSSCELGQVTLSMENQPAVTESIENLQRSLAKTHGIHRLRRVRELWKRPPPPGSSADKLTAAASRPLKPSLLTASPTSPPSKYRLIGGNNLYYNTRLI